MKQIILNFKTGALEVEEVPAPLLQPGGVLVRNHHSLISAGTETSAVDLASRSLLGKARARPDLAKKVMDKARKDGALTAYRQAMSRLDKPEPLGYSCAGEVVEVGEGVSDLAVGDRVACGGVGYASHAEIVYVPRNLCVKLEEGVDTRHAAFTTVGAIAMQGVRTAQLQLGETAVVIGLGLLGQITVQLLKAAGVRVVGVDLDPAKVALAKNLGADAAFARGEDALERKVVEACGNGGADAVVITAATSSNDPIDLAGAVARMRGKVVAVGAVKMDVPRNLYYEKELSVLLSRSYGPGRYDPEYEEGGRDYPLEYVRWTENRNMESFVHLLARRAVDLEPLVTHEFPPEDAAKAYETLNGKAGGLVIGMLFRYDLSRAPVRRLHLSTPAAQSFPAPAGAPRTGPVALGVAGAGTFATSTLLPAAAQVPALRLHALSTATGVSAKKVGSKFGFAEVTTDTESLVADPALEAVAILTRNSLHAPLAIRALEAGKHVFVEKPLALDDEQLDALVDAWRRSPGHVFVGFNRRHSPYGREVREFFAGRSGPLVAVYRVNAETVPANHWIYDPAEGGGRLVTETCHFIDFVSHVVGAAPRAVTARALEGGAGDAPSRENISITLDYPDGSVATVVYTNLGDPMLGKEHAEFFADGRSASLKDFRDLRLFAGGKTRRRRNLLSQEKGHKEELEAFAALCRKPKAEGERLFLDAVAVTRATFAARRSLAEGRTVEVRGG